MWVFLPFQHEWKAILVDTAPIPLGLDYRLLHPRDSKTSCEGAAWVFGQMLRKPLCPNQVRSSSITFESVEIERQTEKSLQRGLPQFCCNVAYFGELQAGDGKTLPSHKLRGLRWMVLICGRLNTEAMLLASVSKHVEAVKQQPLRPG